MKKYEAKITNCIDKPKAPHTYCVKDIDFEKLDNNFIAVDKKG